jgi:hypothetical protein
MSTQLKTAASKANIEVRKVDSTPPPAYLLWLGSHEIQQAIYKMSDTPRFIPGNHRRHV